MRLSLHHIGVVVNDITQATADYVGRFGYVIKSEIIHDPTQTAFVRFLQLPGDAVHLELVSPDRPDSKVTNALKKGGGLNHLCYNADDIERAIAQMRDDGMLIIQAPVAAAAFPGRRIAWLMGRDLIPIELLERGRDGQL